MTDLAISSRVIMGDIIVCNSGPGKITRVLDANSPGWNRVAPEGLMAIRKSATCEYGCTSTKIRCMDCGSRVHTPGELISPGVCESCSQKREDRFILEKPTGPAYDYPEGYPEGRRY